MERKKRQAKEKQRRKNERHAVKVILEKAEVGKVGSRLDAKVAKASSGGPLLSSM